MRKIKIKKIILPILIFLLYAFIVNASIFTCDNPLRDETFENNVTFQSIGWGLNEYPLVSPFESFAFGYNQTYTGGGVLNRIMFTNFTGGISSGIFFVQYDVKIGAHGINSPLLMKISNTTSGVLLFELIHSFGGNMFTQTLALNGFETCTFSEPSSPYLLTLKIDLTDKLYTVFIDEEIKPTCFEKRLTTDAAVVIKRVQIYQQIDNNEFVESFADNIIICGGESTAPVIKCDFPSLFCDDFNYDVPMAQRNWIIQLGGGVVNNSFIPINNKLTLTNTQNIFPYHETDAFETSYRPDSGSIFTRHIYSPIFSSEFTLVFHNETDNEFFYTASEKQTITAYSIKADTIVKENNSNASGNMNWYYLNQTQPSTQWVILCGNCTLTDNNISIKINSLFQQREVYPFNSSIDDDEIRIYADGVLIGIIEDYLDDRTTYLSQYEFGKLSDGNYTIDNYYVMAGTDKDVSTFEQYFTDFFINDTAEEIILGSGESGDMATALGTIWDDMGLKSTGSRVMSGLFLMFFLALIMFGMAMKMGQPLSATVLIIVELFFMILLTYVKLLPIWLPFVIVLVAAGIGAAAIKMGTQT